MRQYGLLGEHLGHSYSPQIHAAFGEEPYLLFEVAPEQVETFLHSDAFHAVNVTVPYKKTVMQYCDALSERARRIGSVNTVVRREDGSLYGDNTDYEGFSALISHFGITVKGKKALVLGSGGASQTVQAVLADHGARQVITVSRSGENNYENLSCHADADLIVNATPVGMYPSNGQSPILLANFTRCQAVIDLIYNPCRTALLLEAEALGIPAYNGLYMLIAQAYSAASVFRGHAIGNIDLEKLTDRIASQMKNIVLIGMPGCGKSSIGRSLATLLNRELIDTDKVIEQQEKITDIFANRGEEAFRTMETDVITRVSSYSGKIIATGGGVVTRARNLPLLRQNATIVFLDRPIEDLPTDGRPLSASRTLTALAAERMPLYRAWSDLTVSCVGVGETAQKIADLFRQSKAE